MVMTKKNVGQTGRCIIQRQSEDDTSRSKIRKKKKKGMTPNEFKGMKRKSPKGIKK
jgi:hypothetical protein